jgi:predicted  nucleic acid-binding Zn-ribbon protein
LTVFHDLLQVQEHDTAADRLRHRRDHLPELAELRATEDELARLEATLAEVDARSAEAAKTQRRLEGELSLLESKLTELNAKLYSGVVSAARELQAMQSEAATMRERRAGLEDQVLEAMGEQETVDEQLAGLRAKRNELDARGATLRAAVAEAQSEVDRELAAATIPPDIAALYEQLRAHLGGVAAAPLVNGRCGGCHLALPATEIDRLRKEPADALVRCEQCERILVRP